MCIATTLLCLVVAQADFITKIPDGVLIRQTPILVTEKELELLIVTQPPEIPKEFYEHVQSLTRHIRHQSGHTFITRHDGNKWARRLTHILMELPAKPHKRTRRGLLNFVGDLSKSLFGTATQEDVERVAKVVNDIGHSEYKTVKRVNELLAVVNRTNQDVAMNRRRLNGVSQTLNRLGDALVGLQGVVNRTNFGINGLKRNILIERAVSELELFARHFQNQKLYFDIQKSNLESEQLTEILLDRRVLLQILSPYESKFGRSIRPLQWYYEFVRIQPVWISDKLVYRMKLPIIGKEQVLMNQLFAFDNYVAKDKVSVLDIESNVVVDKLTGKIMYPFECKGQNPLVCKNNIRYSASESCEVAIIENRKDKLKFCEAHIRKVRGQTRVQVIDGNHYVISTPGESIQLRCVNGKVSRWMLRTGAYATTIPAGCVLLGNGWSVRAIDQLNSTKTLTQPEIKIPSLELTDIITTKMKALEVSLPHWHDLKPVTKINLEPLKVNKPSVFEMFSTYNHDIGLIVAVIILYVLLVLRLCHCIYVNRILSKLCNKVKKQGGTKSGPEEGTPSEGKLDPEIKFSEPIYPILPRSVVNLNGTATV